MTGCKLMPSWPVDRPRDWASLVNRPLDEPRRQQILESLRRGRPLGGEKWTRKMAEKLGVLYTLNPRGRPGKLKDA